MLKAGAKLPPGAHRHVPEFLRLLRAGSEESGKAGGIGGGSGYAPLLALLRGMSASAIDRELRAMQVLEGSDAEDQAEGLRDLRLLMACLGQQLGGGGGAVANFEFCQGLLQLTLQVGVCMGAWAQGCMGACLESYTLSLRATHTCTSQRGTGH